MIWLLLAMSCFEATRNCSDGGMRGVFPEQDDLLPAVDALAVTVGYGDPWTVCGLDGWESASYVLEGDVQGELAAGVAELTWPGDIFWLELDATPLHEEVLSLRLGGQTGEPNWMATVDTGLTYQAPAPTTVTLEAPTISTRTVGGRTYVSLLGSGTADVDLTGLLIQTMSSQTLYGPEDVATTGEVLLSSSRATSERLAWATSFVGVEDGETEVCVWVRGIDIDQVEVFATETACWTF